MRWDCRCHAARAPLPTRSSRCSPPSRRRRPRRGPGRRPRPTGSARSSSTAGSRTGAGCTRSSPRSRARSGRSVPRAPSRQRTAWISLGSPHAVGSVEGMQRRPSVRACEWSGYRSSWTVTPAACACGITVLIAASEVGRNRGRLCVVPANRQRVDLEAVCLHGRHEECRRRRLVHDVVVDPHDQLCRSRSAQGEPRTETAPRKRPVSSLVISPRFCLRLWLTKPKPAAQAPQL